MLFETTFQKKRNPPGADPLIQPRARSGQNTGGNTVQTCKCGGANASPVPTALPAAGKNPVTGWPVHKRKKKHRPFTGTSAVAESNQSLQPKKRRTVPPPGMPLSSRVPAGKKYIFSSAASEAVSGTGAVPAQRVQAPVGNGYEPQPAVDANPYPAPATSTPVYQPEPVVNPVKQSAYTCASCGGKGSGCTKLSYFDAGSAQLTEAHVQQLTRLAGAILKNGIRFVTITGHTDSQDSDEDNTALGNDRSVVVNRALRKALHQRKPWSQTAIFWKVKTKGESQLVSDTDAGMNRRVVICLK